MKKNFLFFSTADYFTEYLTNKQHEANELSKLGHTIIFVDSIGLRKINFQNKKDLSRIFLKVKNFFNPVKKIKKNFYVITPLIIPFFKSNKIIKFINYHLFAFKFNSLLLDVKIPEKKIILWSYHPFVKDLIDIKKFNKIIYRSVDDLRFLPDIKIKDYIKTENNFVKESNFIFTTNKKLFNRYKKKNKNVFYHSNVVDINFFKPKNVKIKKKIAVYHGVLSDYKINLNFLYRVIKNNYETEFWIVGEERENQNSQIIKKIKRLRNTKFFGYIPYKKIPTILSRCSIGLLPLKINKYTEHMSPMKYYEYISSGLYVISTKFEFMKNLKKNSRTFVTNDLSKFSQKIKKYKLIKTASIKEIQNIVSENTYRIRTKKILRIINEK